MKTAWKAYIRTGADGPLMAGALPYIFESKDDALHAFRVGLRAPAVVREIRIVVAKKKRKGGRGW